MLHFFRASSWTLPDICKRWFLAVRQYAPLYMEGTFHVLVDDGVKQFKEGRRMPGVMKLFQESKNSAKPKYIHGHMFGVLGILAGSVRNWPAFLWASGSMTDSRPPGSGKAHLFPPLPMWCRWRKTPIMPPLLLGIPCSCQTGISSLYRRLKSWAPLTAAGMCA